MEHIGVVKLPLSSRHVLELRDVAFVPSIGRNLIFVSLLDRCGYTFGNGHVSLYYNSLVVGSSTLSDGLYMVDSSSDFGLCCFS